MPLSGSFTGIGIRPTVLSAMAVTSRIVRVFFSESMAPGSGLGTPANYTITEDLGSDPRTVISVSLSNAVTPVWVDLTLDGDTTIGTDNYNVAVSAAFTDFAGNLITTPLDADFDGISAAIVPSLQPSTALAFPLDMYKFLHLEMRNADSQEGNLFVKRYLAGPNEVWQTISNSLDNIPSLWSFSQIDDEFLKYLKHIVGWTTDLAYITDSLDNNTLRRLIGASGAMWRTRGPEDALINVLSLITGGARMRLWNWFDFRWIIGETLLGEEHEHNDPWIIDAPEESRAPMYSDVVAQPNAERFSNLRIVDDGNLDRTLVKNVINLMRPAGERYDIVYIDFLDLFSIEGDFLQWDKPSSLDLVVEDGLAKLVDTTITESTTVIVEGSPDWDEYVYAAKIKGTCIGAGGTFGLLFYHQDFDNCYQVVIDTIAQTIALVRRVGGTPTVITTTTLASVDTSILDDVFYTIRVEVIRESGTNRIIVFMDGQVLINTTNNQYTEGTIGIFHTANGTIQCDDAEMFQLPVDSEILEIN